MLVSDLYRDLSYGELSNLSLANNGDGTIRDDAKPRLILYANEALLRLHSQFTLKEQDVLVQMHAHVTFYHLLPRFALHAGTAYVPPEPLRYILDMPEEHFQGDVLSILAVHDTMGRRLALNDEHSTYSAFTPQADILQIPTPIQGQAVSVHYQTTHRRLVPDDPSQEIYLPEVLRGALTAFIAYKVFSHMNTQESTAKAAEHLQVYQGICKEAEDRNTLSTSLANSFVLFELRGWV